MWGINVYIYIIKHVKGDGDCYYQLNGLTTLEKQQPRIKEYSRDFKLTQMGIWPTGSTLFPKGNMRRILEQECISFFFFTIYMHLCQRIHFVSENNMKQLYLACFMNQHISFGAMKTKPLLLQERRIWANYNNSLIWIKAIWGWFPLLTMISTEVVVRSL